MINRKDIFILFSVFGILFLFVILVSFAAGSASGNFWDATERSVGVVEITGIIIDPKLPVETLEQFIKDKNIPVIVVRLETPGGGVEASQEIYETVLKAKRAGKRVIASMGAVAASGGYYIAAGCDTIFAMPSTMTGSIGVIANFTDFSQLMKKIGVDVNARKSGKFKDIGSVSRVMTDEEKAVIDSLISDIFHQFVETVASQRNMPVSDVLNIADGRVYTGRQAIGMKLVDAMGTYQDVIDYAGVSVGLGKNPPVHMGKEDLWKVLMESVSTVIVTAVEKSFPHFSYQMSI